MSPRGAKAPGHVAALDHFLEHLPVPERVHGPPEALMLIGHEAVGFDQAVERFDHELFAVAHILEDLTAKNEIPAIDPDVGLLARAKASDRVGAVELGEVKGKGGVNGNEAADVSASLEALDHLRQRRVGQPVAVVGKKHLFVLDEMPNCDKSLADVAPDARVDEGNCASPAAFRRGSRPSCRNSRSRSRYRSSPWKSRKYSLITLAL